MKKSIYGSGNWYKGNTHAHTTKSDGGRSPSETAAGYAAKGYDFLAISDHERFENNADIDVKGLTVIPAIERSLNGKEFRSVHLVGLKHNAEPYRTFGADLDNVSPQIICNEMINDGLYVILAHPVWSRMYYEDLYKFSGFSAVEVLNYGCKVMNDTGYAQSYWDDMLRKGIKVNAIASDDGHRKNQTDHYGGFVMVKAENKDAESIINSLKSGNYFSSEAPLFKDIYFENGFVNVECSPCREINFIAFESFGLQVSSESPTLNFAQYKINGLEKYVRIELVDNRGLKAWSNPIYHDDLLKYKAQ